MASEKEVYAEPMTARVNVEEKQHEVILRGTKSAHRFVLRNEPGAKSIINGGKYELRIVAIGETAEPAASADTEKKTSGKVRNKRKS